jgi:hypothetical protein
MNWPSENILSLHRHANTGELVSLQRKLIIHSAGHLETEQTWVLKLTPGELKSEECLGRTLALSYESND